MYANLSLTSETEDVQANSHASNQRYEEYAYSLFLVTIHNKLPDNMAALRLPCRLSYC